MEALPTFAAIMLYLILGTSIAWASKKYLKKDVKDFYTAGGRFGTILAALSYAATTYSAFMFIGLVGLAYSSGVGALGFELVYFVGTLFLLYYIAPRYWALHRSYGYVSPMEVLSDRYGSKAVGAIVTLFTLVALIPYASAQVIGVAFAAEGSSGGAVPYAWAVIIAVAIALLWTLVAGIWSVGLTDVFQGIIMMAAGILTVTWVYSWSQGGDLFTKIGALSYVPNQSWSVASFVNLTIPWFFFAITNPQVVQRLFSPKDEKALKGMVIWFGVYGIFFTVLVTVLGIMLRGMTIDGIFPNIAYRDSVTPTLLGIAPLWLSILGLVAVIAASTSTIDGIILTLSSMTVRDLLKPYRPSDHREILVGRVTIAILALACTIFAFLRPGFIVDLSVLSSSLLLPQAPVVIGMFLWRRGGKLSAISTIVVGFTIAVSLTLLKLNPLGIPVNLWTLIASTISYAIVAFLEEAPEGADRFMRVKGWTFG